MKEGEISYFLSIILVTSNESQSVIKTVRAISSMAAEMADDYEIVIVDNGSRDDTVYKLESLTKDDGEPNLQVYVLSSPTEKLTARWLGIENCLGDIAICVEPENGDLDNFKLMAYEANKDCDIVLATKKYSNSNKIFLSKRILYNILAISTRFLTGLKLNQYSTGFIALNRKVINYLLMLSNPEIKFRNISSVTGFRIKSLNISYLINKREKVHLRESLRRGIKLVTSSSKSPLRIATLLSAIGAVLSMIYSFIVLLIWASIDEVTPGWTSVSLQNSIMYFMFSVVLLILSEYILEISRKSNAEPNYYISNEFTSAVMLSKKKLNVEFDTLSKEKFKKHDD